MLIRPCSYILVSFAIICSALEAFCVQVGFVISLITTRTELTTAESLLALDGEERKSIP
jgi:hypothetical protein